MNDKIKELHDGLVKWLRNYFEDGEIKAVIDVSGSVNSIILSALLVEAIGKENVYAIEIYDGHTPEKDVDYIEKAFSLIGLDRHYTNIREAFGSTCISIVESADRIDLPPAVEADLLSRMRTTTVYTMASLLSKDARVVNTSDYSQNYLGWTTKGGDSIGDVSPLANLTRTEVCAIGDYIDLPPYLVRRPSTDEAQFGFSYAALDKFIRDGDSSGLTKNQQIKAVTMHLAGLHKVLPMPAFNPHKN